MSEKELYIGYLAKMPKSFYKTIRVFVLAAFAVAIVLIGILWSGQKPFANSFFEFGSIREFEGTVQAKPIPFLLVEREKKDGLPEFTRYPLVGEGKHGVGEDLTNFDGQRVKLKGTRIYRNEMQMIEVASGSVVSTSETSNTASLEPKQLGNFTLKGEIVDSKCYLGVMNPGQSKPHRECAVACIRGGVPPMFIVKDAAGNMSELWLLSENGGAINDVVLDHVAEPVEISGEVVRYGDDLFFRIDGNSIRRL